MRELEARDWRSRCFRLLSESIRHRFREFWWLEGFSEVEFQVGVLFDMLWDFLLPKGEIIDSV